MNKIPTEILICIFTHIDGPLADYATVCKAFQDVVEARTFLSIGLESSIENIQDFRSHFADTRRRRLLRVLLLRINLPRPEKGLRGDAAQELFNEEENKIYVAEVNGLFAQLQNWTNLWSDEVSKTTPSNLEIYILPIFQGYHTRNRTHITINEHPDMPSVTCTESYDYPEDEQYCFPCVIPIIAEARPDIKRMRWEIHVEPTAGVTLIGYEVGDNELIIHPRLMEWAASALSSADFTSLEVLQLRLIGVDPSDQEQDLPYLPRYIRHSLDNDRMSSALNRVLKLPNLKELDLRGVFTLSPDLFKLGKDDLFSSTLQTIRLELTKATPAAGWYFTPGRSSGRQHPDPVTFDPFLVALARTVVKMPRLESLSCLFPETTLIRYYAPGIHEPCRIDDCGFVYRTSNVCRWVMHFEMEACFKDGRAQLSDWSVPSEVVEILKEANHRILLMRGCLDFGVTSEEL